MKCHFKWIGKVDENNYSAFAILKALGDHKKYDMISADIQENIKSHLPMLADEFNRYFLEYNQIKSEIDQKLIRNSFSTNVEDIADEIQEKLINFKTIETSKMRLCLNFLSSFDVKNNYLY